MRLRRSLPSAILFLVSVIFLLYSKTLFTSRSGAESKATQEMQAATDCQALLLPNKDYYPYLKKYFQKAETSIVGTIYLVKTSNYPDNEPSDLLRELIAA